MLAHLLYGGDSQSVISQALNRISVPPERAVPVAVGTLPLNCRFYVQYCTNLSEKAWKDIDPNGFISNGSTNIVYHNQETYLPTAFYRASSRAAGQ